MSSRDSRYATLLIVGIGMIVGGFLMSGMLGIISPIFLGLGILLILAGMIMTGMTLASGLVKIRQDTTAGSVLRIDNARIVARFAINGIGETLFDESYIDWDDRKTKLYVRIHLPGGRSEEYRCNQAVWTQCGEGMTGTALVQGDWLGQFLFAGVQGGVGNPYANHPPGSVY